MVRISFISLIRHNYVLIQPEFKVPFIELKGGLSYNQVGYCES
jgi:hypothetical protein